MKKSLKTQQKEEALLKAQCSACPLMERKFEDPPEQPGNLDILIISEQSKDGSYAQVFDLDMKHTFMVECKRMSEKIDKDTATCCLGRKLSLIENLKPKMVISVGYDVFKQMEQAFGHEAGSITYFQPLPTCYKGHKFWHFSIPDFDSRIKMGQAKPIIFKALSETPECYDFDSPIQASCLDSGIELIFDNEDIDKAFDYLETQSHVAIDLETNGIRPYAKDAKILSIALSSTTNTYAFPILHPQTPSDFDYTKVLGRLERLSKKVKLVAHNMAFELEWLSTLVFDKFWMYECDIEDTMAQAYLLSPSSKKLDQVTRRTFGFSLKKYSDIDVANLINEPLEKVLLYNARDAKWTVYLFHYLDTQILLEELDEVYRRQVQRIPAVVLMEQYGLLPNYDFIHEESASMGAKLEQAYADFYEIPEVQKFIDSNDGKKPNPKSHKDLKDLLHNFVGVPVTVKSFDEEFLSQFHHPISKPLLAIRELQKAYSTFLLPLNPDLEEGGANIYPDGRIHTSFNSMNAITGRFSSSDPNVQQIPKYLRKAIRAEDGKILIAIDFGQIEYRMIATLTKDETLIKAIWDGYDIHMEWAKQIIKEFGEDLLEKRYSDLDPEKRMKAMRQDAKNLLVFPLCFGSSWFSVAGSLKLPSKKMDKVCARFFEKHGPIKNWHNKMKSEHDANLLIKSPFGRKYRAPLSWNEIINYPIQGSASDIVVEAMVKLAKMSIELDEEELCPRINCHDELVFMVSPEKLEILLPEILKVMLDTSKYQDWLKVPLVAEVSLGENWGSLEKLGDFSSVEFSE